MKIKEITNLLETFKNKKLENISINTCEYYVLGHTTVRITFDVKHEKEVE